MEHARRAAMKISQAALAGPCPGVDSRVTVTDTFRQTGRLAQNRSQPAVQAGDPEAQDQRSTATLIGWSGRIRWKKQRNKKVLPPFPRRAFRWWCVCPPAQRVNAGLLFKKPAKSIPRFGALARFGLAQWAKPVLWPISRRPSGPPYQWRGSRSTGV